MEFNANIPQFKCWVRKEFLCDQQEGQGEFELAYPFAVNSTAGLALSFHVFLPEWGAVYSGIPIHALCSSQAAPVLPIDYLQLWNCFSYEIAVIQYDLLLNLRCKAILKDKTEAEAEYLFTVDWFSAEPNRIDTTWAEHPDQHKCAHIMELANGCYAALPNNRTRFFDPSLPYTEEKPPFKINTRTWNCETRNKWVTEDSDNFFYETQNIALN